MFHGFTQRGWRSREKVAAVIERLSVGVENCAGLMFC
jgi:hypothetical protein